MSATAPAARERLSPQLRAVLSVLPADDWLTAEEVAAALRGAGEKVHPTPQGPRFGGFALRSSLRELRRSGRALSDRGEPPRYRATRGAHDRP